MGLHMDIVSRFRNKSVPHVIASPTPVIASVAKQSQFGLFLATKKTGIATSPAAPRNDAMRLCALGAVCPAEQRTTTHGESFVVGGFSVARSKEQQ